MLGMLFGDIEGSVEDVTNNNLCTTQRMRRDTANCLATEKFAGRKVFTIDNCVGQSYKWDRHVSQSVSKINLAVPILLSLTGHVHQTCLEHLCLYWPTGMMLHAGLSMLTPFYGSVDYQN
jgi:hypothetical protein